MVLSLITELSLKGIWYISYSLYTCTRRLIVGRELTETELLIQRINHLEKIIEENNLQLKTLTPQTPHL